MTNYSFLNPSPQNETNVLTYFEKAHMRRIHRNVSLYIAFIIIYAPLCIILDLYYEYNIPSWAYGILTFTLFFALLLIPT
jgi:hypothetical protein